MFASLIRAIPLAASVAIFAFTPVVAQRAAGLVLHCQGKCEVLDLRSGKTTTVDAVPLAVASGAKLKTVVGSNLGFVFVHGDAQFSLGSGSELLVDGTSFLVLEKGTLALSSKPKAQPVVIQVPGGIATLGAGSTLRLQAKELGSTLCGTGSVRWTDTRTGKQNLPVSACTSSQDSQP